MSAADRTTRAIARAEMRGMLASVRATSKADPLGHAAIIAGQAAARAYRQAESRRRALLDRQLARAREEVLKQERTRLDRIESFFARRRRA